MTSTHDYQASSAEGVGQPYSIGDVDVRRVVEWNESLFTRGQAYADSDRDDWAAARAWLEPRFWNSSSDSVPLTIQSFLLCSNGKLVLVDTGIGNHKSRPAAPPFDDLDTDFIEKLRRAGAAPEDIDIVVLTHLHSDHVGWNTVLESDTWVPTFPNARYLVPRTEFDFWNPAGSAAAANVDRDAANVFADSIAPIVDAGLLDLWEDVYDIDESLRLERVPGHTPGSAILTVSSRGQAAIFIGDLLSAPMMIVDPDLLATYGEHYLDADPDRVRAARRAVLDRAVEHGARLVPAHVDVDGGLYVQRAGNGYAFTVAEPDAMAGVSTGSTGPAATD